MEFVSEEASVSYRFQHFFQSRISICIFKPEPSSEYTKVMYVPKLRTRYKAKEVRVQLYGDQKGDNHPGPTQPHNEAEKRRMESNPSLSHNRNRLPT